MIPRLAEAFAPPAEIQKELMRHSNLKKTLEIHIEPDVAPAHREATSGVVRALLGKTRK